MPEFEPIVLLPSQKSEYERKPGGGGPKTPIVEVDQNLRSGLVTQLQAVEVLASQRLPGYAQGVPLTITVRDEALAKTKRPYAFLDSADLTPVAGEGRGEMISRATPQSTRALASLIETRSTKADIFAISTFESFRVWDPVDDAIPVGTADSADDLLDQARASGLPLRVELFPWLSVQSLWGNDPRTTLEEYLAEVGLPVIFVAGSSSRTALYLAVTDAANEQSLRGLVGIRSAVVAPSYAAPGPVQQQGFRQVSRTLSVQLPPPDAVEALVGVLDSGISTGVLDPWVARRFPYDLGSELDTTHGTFVAGLVVASRDLNDDADTFPRDPARVYDGQVLSKNGSSEDIIIERITEVLDQSGPSGPRVWNCSFNYPVHMDPVVYGTLSQELDLLSLKHGVLFVQSAGNCDPLRTVWPPDGSTGATDALATPAESVHSLTVGSLSHLGGLSPVGAVSSYSRRGPSFGGQQKPEVGYWSGDVDANFDLSGYGVRSVGPGDVELESVGTSFATPVVSSIAANVWLDLEDGKAVNSVSPALVKGLVIHSATVANMPIEDDHRPYYGAGVPRGESLALFDRPHTFTTIHEVELRTGVNWEKRPFPMPDCLFDGEGKIKAAVSVTLAFAPVIDPAFGEECVRTCIELSFGRYGDKKGKEAFFGKMGGSHDWERDLVERGKWSPIKTYRQVWKNGIDGSGDWALKLRLTARDTSIEPLTQPAYVIVTVEGLDESLPVYQDGLAAIASLHYPSSLAVDAGRLRVGNRP
jgi:serine protease AprX